MKFVVKPSTLAGAVRIPGSKSHTVRAVLFAALAEGESVVQYPLDSADARSALSCAEALGAVVEHRDEGWWITGTGGHPRCEGQTIDVGNSGTTLYLALALAALGGGWVYFDGDAQIRARSAAPLLNALKALGVEVESSDGCCPIGIRGPLRGGTVSMECPTSQYLTAMLMAAPLADEDIEIDVPLLHEAPYVGITLDWLDRLGIRYTAAEGYAHVSVPGGQHIGAFTRAIPADFSSATFFLVAAAVTGSELLVQGLDMSDSQGDKAVVEYLRAMGAVLEEVAGGVRVQAGARLRGVTLDLNATPDALPAMAVAAACAEGESLLGNVPQARIKETDRIAVMARELSALGVSVDELADGLRIAGGGLRGGVVHGHADHRVVMSLAVAGLVAREGVVVDTAEAAAVTFPDFAVLMQRAGAALVVEAE